MKQVNTIQRERRNKSVRGGIGRRAARTAAAVLLISLLIITHTGCGDKEPVSGNEFCLDTSCEIKLYGMDGSDAERIIAEAFDNIRQYENMLSKTVEGSDIYRINNAKGSVVEVSEETAELIDEGIRMAQMSDGAFDITVGRLTSLWDFKSEDHKIPDTADIDAALSTVDYRQIETAAKKNGEQTVNTVRLVNSGAQLDLGGIAKGYIADRTAEFLEEKGVEQAIINLGGNVAVIGEKDDDVPWSIGIERPYSDRSEIIGTVDASDATVVTSGIYERMFKKNGRIYHHVLDPKSGYPVQTDLEAVTVMAAKGNSGFCDGLSTICLMLGKERALELINEIRAENPQMKLEAALTDRNDNVTQTDGMKITYIKE